MSERVVEVTVEERIGVITLNAPEKGNAIDQRFCDQILYAVHAVEADDAVRAVLLQARGRNFCVGGDLGGFTQAEHLGRYLRELTGTLHMAMARLQALPKPVVTAVNGSAAGAGLGLALVGDVVLAARSAKFVAAYPAIGLSPDAGLSFQLPHLVGLRLAQEMLLLNRMLDAGEAEANGLITRAVDDAALAQEARAVAERFAEMPARALGRTKRLLARAFETPFEVQLEAEARAIAECGMEPDAHEGVSAFTERRRPNFT